MIKPKVSVIIPVYNTEKFLNKCLDSVCNQTLKDIEVICINDCSTDSSLNILKTYADRDCRVKIINFEKNRGVSVARNAGIKVAEGEFIGFVDSDDWISPDFYEKLCKLTSDEIDIVKGSVKCPDDDNNNFADFFHYYFDNNQGIRENKGNFFFYFCTAIYKKEVIDSHNIRFYEDLQYAEDLCFVAKAVACCNKIECADDVFYYYVRNENSAMQSILTKGNTYQKSCALAVERMIVDIVNETNELFVYDAQFQRIITWIIVNSKNYKFDQEVENRCINIALESYIGKRNLKEVYLDCVKQYNTIQHGIFVILRKKMGTSLRRVGDAQ